MVRDWRVEVPFFAPLKWWGKAFLAKHLSRVLKAVRVQANRFSFRQRQQQMRVPTAEGMVGMFEEQ